MLVQTFATIKAPTRFSHKFALTHVVALLVTAIMASDNGNAAPDEKPATSNVIRHSDLSVYVADDGTLKPIRTLHDWELRRKQVITGAEAAMGEMRTAEKLPFDPKLSEDVRVGDVRRITMTIAIENSEISGQQL